MSDEITNALHALVLQVIGASAPLVIGLVLAAVGAATAWFKRQAKVVAEDAAVAAEYDSRTSGRNGVEKLEFAIATAREKLPPGKLRSPSDSKLIDMIEASIPFARERVSRGKK